MPNLQVTHGTSLDDARSESVLRIDPTNSDRIVGVSRKCKDISAYDFTVATVYSSDGGTSWHDGASPATPGWTGLSDPALAWDDSGIVFLIGAAITNPPKIDYVGIAVYKSTDGGKTWSPPKLIHTSAGDEKAWAAGDSGSASYHGRVYIAWDDFPNLRFARTLDHGTIWIGTGIDPAGSVIAMGSFSPAIAIATNGDISIVRSNAGEIKMIVSTDGGDRHNDAGVLAHAVEAERLASLPRRDLSRLHDADDLHLRRHCDRGLGGLPRGGVADLLRTLNRRG